MNKDKNKGLSAQDRQCLQLIEQNIQLTQRIIGDDAIIYYDLRIRPLFGEAEHMEVISLKRLSVFTRSSNWEFLPN